MEEDILALSDRAGVTERFRVTDEQILAWPAERLWRRIRETIKEREEDARQDVERWILQSWSLSRTIFNALRFGDEMPPTKEQFDKQDKKPTEKDFGEWERVREQMKESNAETLYSIQSPQHHAASLGATGYLDDPPETLEEFKKHVEEAGKPDIEAMQNDLDASNDRMRERRLKERAEREHRREAERSP